mmetsp:Transcript_26728/g.37239  ORF Transcript_26728/g.37239 Transcript_26728/m.37239 type:complete len:113 (-) Transcript_26728:29-367(-)
MRGQLRNKREGRKEFLQQVSICALCSLQNMLSKMGQILLKKGGRMKRLPCSSANSLQNFEAFGTSRTMLQWTSLSKLTEKRAVKNCSQTKNKNVTECIDHSTNSENIHMAKT